MGVQQVILDDGAPTGGTGAVLSAQIDAAFGSTRGAILTRQAAGWAILAPGVDGYVLTSAGVGADVDWEAGSGGAGGQLMALEVKFSNEVTAIAAATSLISFPIPFDLTGVEMFVALATPQASGSIFTVDVNANGTSMLSTKLTIDNTENDSSTAAVAAVVSTTTLAKYDRVTVDVDQIGNGTAKGGTLVLTGYRAAGAGGADGAPGADGKTVLSGTGAPGSGTGLNGDHYIDTAARVIYGPKSAGAWPGGVSMASVQRTVLAADVTNNDAVANTLADVTGLSFPVVAGGTYKFRAVIRYTAAATGTGSRWSVSGPAAPTFLTYRAEYSLTTTTRTNIEGSTAYNLPAASNATSAATAGNIAIIEGIIKPSASGDVIARFASEVASSAIVAKAGSFIEWESIA